VAGTGLANIDRVYKLSEVIIMRYKFSLSIYLPFSPPYKFVLVEALYAQFTCRININRES
jgi:hypothetical protein